MTGRSRARALSEGHTVQDKSKGLPRVHVQASPLEPTASVNTESRLHREPVLQRCQGELEDVLLCPEHFP